MMISLFTKVYHRVNIRSLAGWAAPPKTNPGIHLRRKALNSTEDLEEEDTEFDELESDFMNVHKSHREHIHELKTHKEKEKFHVVKQKYFKETHFNFLTWHDKEQIRYLHNSDPEEWTAEKLSEGFPALPQDIKKIMKSKWSINTRMKSHDRSVRRNWESFRKGEITDLPKDLVDHLNKFTDRAFNFKPFEPPEKIDVAIKTRKPASTEFSDIITSYRELKNKNKRNRESKEMSVNVDTDSVDNDQNMGLERRTVKGKPVTLLALQNKLEDKVNSGSDLSVDEKLLIRGIRQAAQEPSIVELTQSDVSDIIKNKYDTTTAGVQVVDKKPYDVAHLIYPQKIVIPKNIRKRGYTYKLNDCYYDDYGRFLYRVPGMD